MRYVAVFSAIVLILLLVMGSVTPATEEDHAKIIMIVLGVHKNSVVEESVEVRYGHPPNLGHQHGNFTATVLARNGTPLFTFDVWDPRYQLDEYGLWNVLEQYEQAENQIIEQVYRDQGETTDIDLPLIIPYNRDIQTVDLVDKNSGYLLVSVNISPAMDAFRNRFPRDPDMIANTPPVLPASQPVPGQQNGILIAGSVLAVILLALLFRLIRKT